MPLPTLEPNTGIGSRPQLLLIPGAAHTKHIWNFWQNELDSSGWSSCALNLRGHGKCDKTNLSSTSIYDYLEDVRTASAQMKLPPVLVGWSMGATVALLAASEGIGSACVALDPSMPVRTADQSVKLRHTEFDPDTWNITVDEPDVHPLMPDLNHEERRVIVKSLCRESQLALDEQSKKGIVIENISSPVLVVRSTMGEQFEKGKFDSVWFKIDQLEMESTSHWGLVLNRRVLSREIEQILEWFNHQNLNMQSNEQLLFK